MITVKKLFDYWKDILGLNTNRPFMHSIAFLNCYSPKAGAMWSISCEKSKIVSPGRKDSFSILSVLTFMAESPTFATRFEKIFFTLKSG
jgi:hypothetical protein